MSHLNLRDALLAVPTARYAGIGILELACGGRLLSMVIIDGYAVIQVDGCKLHETNLSGPCGL